MYRPHLHIHFNICSSIIIIFALISCGRQNSTVKFDDHPDSTGEIAFIYGVGNRPVEITPSEQIKAEDTKLITALKNAIDTWNQAIGKQILLLSNKTDTKTGNSFTSACEGEKRRVFYPLCDQIFGSYFDKKEYSKPFTSGWAFNTGKDENVIATTIWHSNGGYILNADIRLNRDGFKFGDTTIDGNDTEDNVFKFIADMETIYLHELGHLLGLGHIPNEPDSIMYPSIQVGPDMSNLKYSTHQKTIKRTLSQSDISRIQSIYNK